ncbi:MAG: hypothetical protein AAB414_05010 [Patescibacteria group bacterium]
MIFFWVLFLIVILISLILAFMSMKDFRQNPKDFNLDYGLFLVRRPSSLTPQVFDYLHQEFEKTGLIISIERLFKGRESAIVLYGPRKILINFTTLDLLELEDYTNKLTGASIWQMSARKKNGIRGSLFLDIPKLFKEEEILWQIILQAQKGGSRQFRAQILVAVLISDENRKKEISMFLQAQKGDLIKVPQNLSSIQMMNFYQKRTILGRSKLTLTGGEIAKLLSLPKLH